MYKLGYIMNRAPAVTFIHTYEKKIMGSEEMVQKFNLLYFTYTRFD